jgi:hypothetical protein
MKYYEFNESNISVLLEMKKKYIRKLQLLRVRFHEIESIGRQYGYGSVSSKSFSSLQREEKERERER